MSQRDLLRKYFELHTFQQFLRSFDMSVFGKLQAVNEYIDGQTDYRDEQEQPMATDMEDQNEALRNAAQNNLAFGGGRAAPLIEN